MLAFEKQTPINIAAEATKNAALAVAEPPHIATSKKTDVDSDQASGPSQKQACFPKTVVPSYLTQECVKCRFAWRQAMHCEKKKCGAKEASRAAIELMRQEEH